MQSVDNGTQQAVIGTEHTLSTQSDAGVYVFVVDTFNMAVGDIVVLSIRTKCKGSGASRLAYTIEFAGMQTEPMKYSVPVPVDIEFVCTLTQTDGTAKSFDWTLLIM